MMLVEVKRNIPGSVKFKVNSTCGMMLITTKKIIFLQNPGYSEALAMYGKRDNL